MLVLDPDMLTVQSKYGTYWYLDICINFNKTMANAFSSHLDATVYKFLLLHQI